jgi:hypothetical protein
LDEFKTSSICVVSSVYPEKVVKPALQQNRVFHGVQDLFGRTLGPSPFFETSARTNITSPKIDALGAFWHLEATFSPTFSG